MIDRAACWAMTLWLGSCMLASSSACSSPAVPVADGATPDTAATAPVSTTASTEVPPSGSAPEPVASAPKPEAPPSGPFTSDRVREIVRKHYDEVGACYQAGLDRDPKMKGTIEVHLAIGEDGMVLAANASKDPKDAKAPKAPRAGRPKAKKEEPRIADAEVVSCVEKVFIGLRFPPTGRGLVNMIYPVVLAVE